MIEVLPMRGRFYLAIDAAAYCENGTMKFFDSVAEAYRKANELAEEPPSALEKLIRVKQDSSGIFVWIEWEGAGYEVFPCNTRAIADRVVASLRHIISTYEVAMTEKSN